MSDRLGDEEECLIRPMTLAPRRMTTLGIGLVVAAMLSTSVRAQSGGQTLFVENTNSGDVSVIDNASLAVVGTIPVGLSPDDIVSSPDGRALYVSRIVRGENGRPSGKGEVVAVDPGTRTVLWRAPLSGVPNHLAVAPNGKHVYVTIVSTSYVDIVDPARHVVVDSVNVGIGPHDILVTPDGKRVYVGLIRGNKVTIFDAASHRIIRQIPFDAGVRPIALTNDERRLFVQLSYFHGFVVVDPNTGKTIAESECRWRRGTRSRTQCLSRLTTGYGSPPTADTSSPMAAWKISQLCTHCPTSRSSARSRSGMTPTGTRSVPTARGST